jgi:sulfite reductase (ferredoxin)
MIRIKLPLVVTSEQLVRITKVSDEYSTGRLHTPRQDIQIHYVSLDRTPELWAKSIDDITCEKLVEIQLEILQQVN